MKKETILITGAGPNGVTGNRIKERFIKDFDILNPSSSELDLTDTEAVTNFFYDHKIDFVIHSAVIYPKEHDDGFFDNIRMYFNLARHNTRFSKMFYFGSGAEYDKSRDIVDIPEQEIGKYIPKDPYGLCKFIMQEHADKSDNIYNIRLFGTINPNEQYTKNVISNLCIKAAKRMPMTLRKNCRFSFTDIDDVAEFIYYGITNGLKYHNYNFLPENNYLLSEIAERICEIAGIEPEISFLEEGLNREYTGSAQRIISEFNHFTSLSKSLAKVYNRMENISSTVYISEIDGRWRKN